MSTFDEQASLCQQGYTYGGCVSGVDVFITFGAVAGLPDPGSSENR
jgi:hypothetical protein